jgi:macrolide-specific efflux system membrane fusion protein
LTALVLAGPPTVESAPLTDADVKIDHCVIALIDDLQVPAREAGVLVEIGIKEGHVVKRGDVLGKIDKRDAELQLRAAEIEEVIAGEQAKSEVEVLAAEKAKEVAEEEYNGTVAINARTPGTIAATQVRREELTKDRAGYQHEAAKLQHDANGLTHDLRSTELDAANHNLTKRDVMAPVDGVVVQVLKRPGEWVQPGDPVLRVVRMNRLRVEGFVNTEEYSPHEIIGKKVTVSVSLRRGLEQQFESKVEFASPIVEANGEYRVWVEVENIEQNGHWVLRPGLEAQMTVLLQDDEPTEVQE